MTSIEEIRKRHEAGSGTLPIVGLAQAETDRATLLAEIDRLRSQVLTLEAVGAESADVIDRLMRDSDVARAEVERLTRERNEARAYIEARRREAKP